MFASLNVRIALSSAKNPHEASGAVTAMMTATLRRLRPVCMAIPFQASRSRANFLFWA